MRCIALVTLLICSMAHTATCQPRWLQTQNDTAYVEDLSKDLTLRFYHSNKYTDYKIIDRSHNEQLVYRPNDRYNFGLGFNYKFLGVNVGFNFPFINNDDAHLGKTDKFDMQAHFYMRKFVVDFWGLYYAGYRIANPSQSLQDGSYTYAPYPNRTDLQTTHIGLQVQYVFNDERFSYRAAYAQNEWQKKSAGSLLAGISSYNVIIRADSSLLPPNLQNPLLYDGRHFNEANIYSLGVNIGYAYTLVIKKHFFITASTAPGIGLSYTKTRDTKTQQTDERLGPQLSNTFRIAAGYNSERFFIGFHHVDLLVLNAAPVPATYQEVGGGNFRASVAYRFRLKRPIVKRFNF